jgi:glucose 1-dehydrogenase
VLLPVSPGKRDSARIDEVPEPPVSDGSVLVETLSLGVCGTDREFIEGQYGWPPAGVHRLSLGHESIGRVLEAPADSALASGNLVVGIASLPGILSSHTQGFL